MSLAIQQAYVASLPPVSYDPLAPNIQREAASVAAVLGSAVASADVVLDEQDPAKAEISLPDWERNYSLPDPCAGLSSTSERRRTDLLHRITGRGNLSAAFMVGVANRYGFPAATVTEFKRWTCNSPCADQIIGASYQFVWRLNLMASLAISRMTCRSPCTTPLRSWGNEALTCAISRAKPAGTRVLLAYSS